MENQDKSSSQASSVNSSQSNPEEIIENYIQEINNLNVNQYISNAKELMEKNEFQNASFIFRAIIRNQKEIYKQENTLQIVDSLVNLAECLFFDTINNGELIGKDQMQNKNIQMISQFIDSQGNFNAQGFQEHIQQGIIQIAQQQLHPQDKENQVPIQASENKVDQNQENLDPDYDSKEEEEESEEEEAGEIDEALECLNQAIDILQGEMNETENSEQIINLKIKLADTYNLMSECLTYEGEFDESLAHLDLALEVIKDVDDIWVLRRLAQNHFLRGTAYDYMSEEDSKYFPFAFEAFEKGKEVISNLISQFYREQNQSMITEFQSIEAIYIQKINELKQKSEKLLQKQEQEELLKQSQQSNLQQENTNKEETQQKTQEQNLQENQQENTQQNQSQEKSIVNYKKIPDEPTPVDSQSQKKIE